MDEGILVGKSDWTGLSNFKSLETLERFFTVGNSNILRTFYPRESTHFQKWTSPFKIEIMLSQNAYIVHNFETYTLADFMIAIGGLSRTVYFIGMFAAHFVAQMLYKKALIQDMFLW